MLAQGSGKIINIASVLSFQGGVRVPAYTASKHAVAGMTKALANEWAARGVNVNAIAPGYMITDNTQALRDDPQRSQQILDRIPAERWGTPADLSARRSPGLARKRLHARPCAGDRRRLASALDAKASGQGVTLRTTSALAKPVARIARPSHILFWRLWCGKAAQNRQKEHLGR